MTDTPPRPALPPEALRALAEAEERRRLAKELAQKIKGWIGNRMLSRKLLECPLMSKTSASTGAAASAKSAETSVLPVSK